MKQPNVLGKTKTILSKISPRSWLIAAGVFVVVAYGLIFFIPKSVQLSYTAQTCVSQFVLAPGIHKASSDDFDIHFENELRVGSVALASTKVCIEPKKTPRAGSYTAGVAPFGGIIARKQFTVTVPEAPKVTTSDIVGKTISTARPLKIKLTSADTLNRYVLQIADKKTDCAQQHGAQLSCDVAALNLLQGATYTAALYRTYKTDTQKVVEGDLKTLQPLAVSASPLSENQTIYDKPTQFAFTFDQPISDAQATLVRVVGDTSEKISLQKTFDGTTLTLAFTELPREAQYKLELTEVIAKNGSSLDKPYTVSFQTSGGPKVSSVSVGANSVSRTARIIVTLDQPIDGGADIAKYARIEGVTGAVSKQSDTQLAFAIQGGDCTAFTLVVDKGLKSASNGEGSKEAWRFGSRTICGYSWSIGTSVKGRPIIAYSFGSGAKTILFTGAIHGSEPSSYSTMLGWAQYLQANGNIVPADKRIVIVPNTNPDGIAAGSRNNSRNVNVGRNFPTANWQASIETASGTLPTGGGTSAGSEPEAQALITLTRQLRPRLEVSFHAQGSLVGANKYGDSVSIGNIYSSTVGYRTMYYDAEAVMGYPMTGEYEDWMGEEMGVPAILIELPTLSGNYFNSQLPALKKLLAL